MPGGKEPWAGRSSIVRATSWENVVEAKASVKTQARQKRQDGFIEVLSRGEMQVASRRREL
jgi:hypothetical protein